MEAATKYRFSCWSKERRPHHWLHASKSYSSGHRGHLQMRYPGLEEALNLCPEWPFKSLVCCLWLLLFYLSTYLLVACLFIYLFGFFQTGFS